MSIKFLFRYHHSGFFAKKQSPGRSCRGIVLLVFAGKVSEKKGVKSLLRSMELLSERGKIDCNRTELYLAGGAGDEKEYQEILALAERAGLAAVFSGSDAEGWKYAVAGQEDVRPLGKALNQAFAGRGGGKAALVQGSVQGTREAIESFVLHTAI